MPEDHEDSYGHTADDHALAEADELISEYREILAELSLLTTVSVLLFGFLLVSPAAADSKVEQWLYSVATVLVASATLVFVLPVAYHHVQYPYRDFEKFQLRSHTWIQVGLPLLAGGLYLSLTLTLWALFDEFALIVAALPVLATVIVFVVRKWQL